MTSIVVTNQPEEAQASGVEVPWGWCSPGRWARQRRRFPEKVGGRVFVELKGLLGECVRRTAVEKACGLRFQPRGTEGEVYPFLGWFREGGIGELGNAFKIPGAGLVLEVRQFFRLRALRLDCGGRLMLGAGGLGCSHPTAVSDRLPL